MVYIDFLKMKKRLEKGRLLTSFCYEFRKRVDLKKMILIDNYGEPNDHVFWKRGYPAKAQNIKLLKCGYRVNSGCGSVA
jgi:hypothetical protein